ncbi:hypothetical protein AMS68_005965 [Peltaster fructicola]|uniref:DUF2828 domain-containing protein n=1 Tax=Peltaster fructicola TaxID=286661 RepID=A0A6H0Y0S8_9PEZI|nr:hypothetical protein AMS68_005965 [Peltaster fructicola]
MAEHSFLKSSFPVLVVPYRDIDLQDVEPVSAAGTAVKTTKTDSKIEKPTDSKLKKKPGFLEAISDYKHADFELSDDKMRTANGDMTYADSGEPLVNLFHQLEDSLAGDRIEDLLDAAWKTDADLTLKVIWNARSIHLGKSSRFTFYRSVGWLAQTHPRTLLNNLRWLVRPIIQKKVPKAKPDDQAMLDQDTTEQTLDTDADSDFEMINADDEAEARAAKRLKIDDSHAELDVKYGLSHGYWKDLLNILALAACDELKADGNVESVLKIGSQPSERDWTAGRKKDRAKLQYKRITAKLNKDTIYKALHMQVAKLFADQLAVDMQRLQSGSKADVKRISMAAKWAPSNKGMHDERTFIVSTIAELLHPADTLGIGDTDRETYLRHARCAYQSKTLSPLRKHLDIVERHLTAKTYDQIKYDRLPSLAMKMRSKLFIAKDEEHFRHYLEEVAAGKTKISGATLLPSTMVAEARRQILMKHGFSFCAAAAANDLDALVADGQWNALVQRIKDSGSMESAIAVCDVSGSMQCPRFADGSTPLDAAIGLSLVLAEVCKPPFGGAFITFDDDPEVIQVEDESSEKKRTFYEKVNHLEKSPWGGSTDLVAVFLKCILPMARKHKLKQDEMVKRVFIFSDMHFNSASSGNNEWSSTFERIKQTYAKFGYEMPELIFWNLASAAQGSRAGIAPMPVQAEEPGTAMLSGYSQAMMRVFMEGGGFNELQPDLSEADTVVLDAEGNEVKAAGEKMTPLGTVKRAVGHDAYKMLKVVD